MTNLHEHVRTNSAARGFTLIELIVSISLFTVVITIAMSAYLGLISLDRKARATGDLVSNLSFVVESMSRSIRIGTKYSCGSTYPSGAPNCLTGQNTFGFTDENNQVVMYTLKADGTIGYCIGSTTCTSGNATSLTDSHIAITNLKFYVQGVGLSDGLQPRTIFTISGTITPDTKTPPVSFTIEGSATQRLIEL